MPCAVGTALLSNPINIYVVKKTVYFKNICAERIFKIDAEFNYLTSEIRIFKFRGAI
jgi:hypothetical protein